VPEIAESEAASPTGERNGAGDGCECDGTTVLMSDSSANQAEYPQHSNQLPGCGFPIAKLVVIFSLLTGAVVAACIAPLQWVEIVSRLLYSDLDPDVLLADQAYGNYVDLAWVQRQGADAVFASTMRVKQIFAKKLGIGDHQVVGISRSRVPST